ncbi:MAG: TlpA family protein disulfide reductase [Polaromonas sp.]|nr:TlpA family protein disulfide reductase [Polaromonas sp.]
MTRQGKLGNHLTFEMTLPCTPPRPGLTASRRAVLQAALAAGVLASPLARGQALTGPAYQVTPWTTPAPPDFELLDITGKTWRLADLKGRAALLNFWASWCEPCRAEMPTLQQVADLYGPDKLLVLAVNFKEPAVRAVQFAKSTGVTLPVLLDLQGKTAQKWGVKVFPTTLLIDSQGRARQRVMGEVDWTGSAAEKLIAGLLKA